MFDIGGSELLVIGIVALIVVGPKDLPGMFRTLGRFTAKARSMAREFSRAMEDAADATGMRETANDIKGLTSKKALGLDELESAATAFEKWDPKRKGGFAPGPLPEAKPASAAVPDTRPEAAASAPAANKPARARAANPAPAPLTDAKAAPAPAPARSRKPAVGADGAPRRRKPAAKAAAAKGDDA